MKTFKRDHVLSPPRGSACMGLRQLDEWMHDYNEFTPTRTYGGFRVAIAQSDLTLRLRRMNAASSAPVALPVSLRLPDSEYTLVPPFHRLTILIRRSLYPTTYAKRFPTLT